MILLGKSVLTISVIAGARASANSHKIEAVARYSETYEMASAAQNVDGIVSRRSEAIRRPRVGGGGGSHERMDLPVYRNGIERLRELTGAGGSNVGTDVLPPKPNVVHSGGFFEALVGLEKDDGAAEDGDFWRLLADSSLPPAPTPVESADPPDAAPTPAELTEPPVAAPVVQPFEFDISQCDTYGLEWLIDLKDSCDDFDTFDGCECSSAQALFDAGEITCAQEGDGSPPACPSDCEVCKACLVRVLGCPDIYDGMDSSDPEAPPAEFDIAQCSSYALEWLIDLQETCTDFDTFEGCECTSAQALFDAGEITCAQEGDGSPPACPSDCEVCKTCLVLDLGCPDVYGGLDSSAEATDDTGATSATGATNNTENSDDAEDAGSESPQESISRTFPNVQNDAPVVEDSSEGTRKIALFANAKLGPMITAAFAGIFMFG